MTGEARSGPRPWMPGDDAPPGEKRHAPATQRNVDAILALLNDVLPEAGTVLEIASGSGEHAVAFARAFPSLTFQPSDPDPQAMASIAAHRAEAGLDNLAAPIALDVRNAAWPIARADAILAINMVHISPWEATLGLLDGAARLLSQGAPLYLYGAYWQDGVDRAPSNVEFDANLRARNPAWGIRPITDVTAAAQARGLVLDRVVSMPANNLSVILRRR
ncbi:MAG: DUF938 domain-containing protein [Sphingomonadales bacterium]|nr:DUF938 domain-containing protein [Sphingomonadales bacterium]